MSKRHPASKKPPSMGAYWLWGRHACAAALDNPERQIRRVVASKNMAEAVSARPVGFPEGAQQHKNLRVEVMEPKAIDQLLGPEAVHQGIALEVMPLEPLEIEDVLPAARPVGFPEGARPLIILDQVTDPHNVGAILRSAAAFGAAAVILPRDHAAPQSGVMARAAAGALDLVPLVYVTNLARALGEIKEAGYWVVGLDGEAKQTMAQAKLNTATALVLGAEGKGMRRLTAESCDLLVKLPISDQMESLNVSNAAAIALYELMRGA